MTAKDSIIALPNNHLRNRSQRIGIVSDNVRSVINKMKEATLDWEASRKHEVGVALAAIQIDQPYRIIVIRRNFENKEDHTFDVFLNPEITKFEGELEDDYEGCLSVLNIYGKVPRYTKIRMKALNENGQEIRIKAEGFLARVLQHEIDHLTGKLFIDHIEDDAEAFYKITDEGKLEKLPYEQVQKAGIFRE
jgi:peptide deformylase